VSDEGFDQVLVAIKAVDAKLDRIEGRLSRLESIQNALARQTLAGDQANALGIGETRDTAMPRNFSKLGVDTQKIR
jgi:hypothetical protein